MVVTATARGDMAKSRFDCRIAVLAGVRASRGGGGIGYIGGMIRYTLLTISAVAMIAACNSNSEPAAEADDTADDTAAEKQATDPADEVVEPKAPDFSKWKPADKQAVWQGSWLVKQNGTIVAWTIDGTNVTTWDGETEKKYTLEITAPCRASFKNDKGYSFPRNFTAVDGALRYGSMGAGYRDGANAIYCDASGAIYVLADDTCTIWEEDFGKWETRDAECGIKKNADGAEVFFHADPNGGDFEITGNAIVSNSSFPTEKVDGDHEAARKAREAKVAK